MDYFFVKDCRRKYRFISSDPATEIGEKVSRTKEIWRRARKKLLLLPPRILRQEQAFMDIPKDKRESIVVHHSGHHPERRTKIAFFFFLQKQRTKHVFFLLGECLLLPLSGLAAFLPGPNVAFAVLALLMITHWQALRGINRLRRKNIECVPSLSLAEWEEAVSQGKEERYGEILGKLTKEFGVSGLEKVLWK